jgi:hypothetical protein
MSVMAYFVSSVYTKKKISDLASFATVYVSEQFTLGRCSLTRKTIVFNLFNIYLAFCKKAIEHRVTD